MKVKKFNENIEKEIIDSINNKVYVVVVYDDKNLVYSGTEKLNLSNGIDKYYDFKKRYLHYNNKRHIFLIEKESKALSEDEIELLHNAKKYNL